MWIQYIERKGRREEIQSKIDEGDLTFEVPIYDLEQDLLDEMLSHPDRCIRVGESAIVSFMDNQKGYLNLRPTEISTTVSLSNLRKNNLRILCVTKVLVRQATKVEPREILSVFRCGSCGFKTEIDQTEHFDYHTPLECPKDDGGCGKRGSSAHFTVVDDECLYIDEQRIEVQDAELSYRTQPTRRVAIIEDELTGMVQPGDEVEIIYVPITEPVRKNGKMTPQKKMWLKILNMKMSEAKKDLDVTEEDKILFREIFGTDGIKKVVESFATNIKGMKRVKTGLALQMVGGSVHYLSGNKRSRGDIHSLLVGDPGTAKSTLAEFMADLFPRSSFVEGKNASDVGVTASVVQDTLGEGKFSLEAGAMVLSNGSICVIDEIHTMNANYIPVLYGPMERQKVAVAKAGINTELNSMTTMVLLANPKYGRFRQEDFGTPLIEQIDNNTLTNPLLDRCDIIIAIYDIPDKDRDREMVKHILADMRGEIVAVVPFEVLRKFLWWVKHEFNPTIPEDLGVIIEDHYSSKRWGSGISGTLLIKKQMHIRHIFTITRLAEASAKIRMSNTVNEHDIDLAFEILEDSLKALTAEKGGDIDLDAYITHKGKTSRESLEYIVETIKRLDINGDGVDKAELYEELENNNIHRIDDYIRRMKEEGMIYSPRGDIIKLLV